ncbi:DUF2155 domain-containing protein [Marinibacterium profundimaris]|uniref:DUF2155 domain-containing protein n=1 Tax=Marinibacterium profundimaris TaxID=1679460 RepID=A0A225NXP0_9RHOB|nr:DUF2155 domain-containing protein [Marinibacterium profundimaris]OWU78047.1 hypothetical protein ATO3_02925 [Marinibacterium profundimaris]
MAAQLVLPAAPVQAQAEAAVSGSGAVLRALDKVNGRTEDFEVRSGQSAEIFNLVVEMADCRYPADNPTGDAFAYLVIREEQSQEAMFAGWMIASSPALNALDHPRYDVWVLRCISS